MITPVIAAQTSSQLASVQRTDENQAILNNQNAFSNVREDERQAREVVTNTEQAVFYEPKYDAKDEGKNKYENLYTSKKKKKNDDEKEKDNVGRVNFDIKI